MQKNKQNEKSAHYEQNPDEDKPDYTPETTYEPQSTSGEQTSDRRGFLKRTGTAVIVGLGGILFGKTALADGIDEVVGEEEGLKKVTDGYDRTSCFPGSDGCPPAYEHCDPHCYPNECKPNNPCHPDCEPHKENITDFKKVTESYDRLGKENSGGVSNCKPGVCRPDYADCTPFCSPPPKPCHPNCGPHS